MRYFVILAVLLLTSLLAFAAAPVMPVVNNDIINYSVSPNTIAVNGSGFKPSTTAPIVLFNNVTLTLVSSSNTDIVANLPTGTQAGSYRLRITNSQGNAYEFDVTYGAVGPQGPIGPQGPMGPTGPTGPSRPPGASRSSGTPRTSTPRSNLGNSRKRYERLRLYWNLHPSLASG
jgi:hypothetical protein